MIFKLLIWTALVSIFYRDKIATGSFDKTCKLWSSETGKCYHTFRGHSAEIVSISTYQHTCIYVCKVITTTLQFDMYQCNAQLFKTL